MNRKLYALGALLCLVFAKPAVSEEKYTMEDLQALDKQGSYLELIKHIDDIRPSKRDDHWKTLAEKSAIHVMDDFINKKHGLDAVSVADQLLMDVPDLQKSRKFMDKRAQAGLAGFPDCFRGYYGSECLKHFEKFVDTDPKNFQLLFKSGKLVRLNMSHHAAVPFFVKAFSVKGADKSKCADEDVALAVKSGLGAGGERLELTKKLAFELCSEKMKPVVMQTFYTMHNPKGICKTLQAQKMLTSFQQAYCRDLSK